MAKIILRETVPPTPPSIGTLTLYARDGRFWLLNSSGIEIPMTDQTIVNQTELDFFEGTNLYIADIDVYGFQDAAGMPVGVDSNILFKLQPVSVYLAGGVTISLVYALSLTDLGKNIRLRLDYVVHKQGEVYSGGTPYGQTYDLTVASAVNVLAAELAFTIPAGHVTTDTLEVEVNLSRLGSDPADTFTGDLGLKHLLVGPA